MSLLIPTATGVILASAAYAYEYYGEWYGGPHVELSMFGKDMGTPSPVAAPPTPPDWPPGDGYGKWPPRLLAEADGVQYSAHGTRIDAHDAAGAPLWTTELDFADPPLPPYLYGPARPPSICWLAAADGLLYVLTSEDTVACFSAQPTTGPPIGLAEQRAFAALVSDEPDALELLSALNEESWIELVEAAHPRETPGQAAFDAYYGGPEEPAARRRWHDRAELSGRDHLFVHQVPENVAALARLPDLTSVTLSGNNRKLELSSRRAILAFRRSRDLTE